MTTKIDELPGYNEVSVSERSSTFASASEDSLGLALVSKASGAVICKCDGTAGQVLRLMRAVNMKMLLLKTPRLCSWKTVPI